MFARCLSLVMILAVIACPLWCGNGRCDAAPCCSSKVVGTSAACCAKHTTKSCSGDSSDDEAPCPVDFPTELSCQGICGGAVLEKPLQLPSVPTLFLTLIDVREVADCGKVESGRGALCDRAVGSGNYGRVLRTLHMSFLC